MELVNYLYRTNNSIIKACEDLNIEFSSDLLEDLEQCSQCSTWYYSYELIPDQDYNNICKFCVVHYGL